MKRGRKKKEQSTSESKPSERLDNYFTVIQREAEQAGLPSKKLKQESEKASDTRIPQVDALGEVKKLRTKRADIKYSNEDEDDDFKDEELYDRKGKKKKKKKEEDLNYLFEESGNESDKDIFYTKEKQLAEKKNTKNKETNKINEKDLNLTKEPKNKRKLKEAKPVGKRGYKFCKGENCKQQLYIHQKICPSCNYSFTFSNPKAFSNQDDSVLVKAEAILKAKKPKKDLLTNSNSVKGSILSKDSLNIDPNYYKVVCGDLNDRLFSEFAESQVKYNLIKDSGSIKESEKSSEKTPGIKFTIVKDSKEKKKFTLGLGELYEVKAEDNNGITQFYLNLGNQINSVAWAPRIGEDQYLAVAVSDKSYENLFSDMELITVRLKKLGYLHKIGKQYPESDGTILIYKISYNYFPAGFDAPKKAYKLKYQDEGTPLVIKWCQKMSSSEVEIGLLSVLTARGHLIILSVPLIDGKKKLEAGDTVEVPILMCINLGPERQLSCFDWKKDSASDEIIAGDIMGNIYWIKIGFIPNEIEQMGYTILSVINEAHRGMITQIDIYPKNNENSCMFASVSFDGVLKVFDFFEGNIPILDLGIFTKPLTEVKWDFGGKFIIICKEGPSAPGELIGLFQRKKVELSHDNITDKLEMRKLEFDVKQRVNFTNTYMACTNKNNCKHTFFSDINGNLFRINNEVFRKTGSTKNKSDTIVNFSRCEFSTEEEEFSIYHSSYLKLHGKASSKNNMSFESTINALHLNPNDLKSLQRVQKPEKIVDNLLAFGNLSGVLSILLLNEDQIDSNSPKKKKH